MELSSSGWLLAFPKNQPPIEVVVASFQTLSNRVEAELQITFKNQFNVQNVNKNKI
jgi:hypothetical protein